MIPSPQCCVKLDNLLTRRKTVCLELLHGVGRCQICIMQPQCEVFFFLFWWLVGFLESEAWQCLVSSVIYNTRVGNTSFAFKTITSRCFCQLCTFTSVVFLSVKEQESSLLRLSQVRQMLRNMHRKGDQTDLSFLVYLFIKDLLLKRCGQKSALSLNLMQLFFFNSNGKWGSLVSFESQIRLFSKMQSMNI